MVFRVRNTDVTTPTEPYAPDFEPEARTYNSESDLMADLEYRISWINMVIKSEPMLGLFGFAYSASVAGFMGARFMLGLGEAGNFPASIKAVAEWFPKKERALATGIFNSGTNVGALLTPLAVDPGHPFPYISDLALSQAVNVADES